MCFPTFCFEHLYRDQIKATIWNPTNILNHFLAINVLPSKGSDSGWRLFRFGASGARDIHPTIDVEAFAKQPSTTNTDHNPPPFHSLQIPKLRTHSLGTLLVQVSVRSQPSASNNSITLHLSLAPDQADDIVGRHIKSAKIVAQKSTASWWVPQDARVAFNQFLMYIAYPVSIRVSSPIPPLHLTILEKRAFQPPSCPSLRVCKVSVYKCAGYGNLHIRLTGILQ